MEYKKMLESLGKDIAEELDRVEFIGIQEGFKHIPDTCTFNCLVTSSTFLTNSINKAERKIKKMRKNFKKY